METLFRWLVLGLTFCDLTCPQGQAAQAPVKGIRVPVNQVLEPAGQQVLLPELRPQALALSPDGSILAVSGKTAELIILDPVTGKILQRVALPPEASPEAVSSHILQPDKEGQVSYTGLVFSPDGRRIYLSNVNGSIKVFNVGANAQVVAAGAFALPNTGIAGRTNEIPAGLAVSPDGRRLYVALNLSNQLLEMDAESGKWLRRVPVGVAPYEVALVRGKAYVSNWGGRRPETNSLTGPAGHGTLVRVDPVRHIASEGSVSVVDLASGTVRAEILTGLHASALGVSPDKRYLFVANAGSDTVTVLDTRTDTVVESISMRWAAGDLFGASPNALAAHPSGKILFVCNGTQNAVAVVDFKPGHSRLSGLIPTGWYPGAIAFDAKRRSLYVANIKGHGSGLPPKDEVKFNSHQHLGTVSLISLAKSRSQMPIWTRQVLKNFRHTVMQAALQPPRPGQPARPVPERIGEPSVFQHVIYIIKENRTYDQVLGDMPEGNGAPGLCIFGEKVTPNQHKLCREFTLLDGTCCSGVLSADGHEWCDTAFATDYMEKSFAGFPRSYPDGMEEADVDALAYAPSGFLWDNALAHGKTIRDYGEFAMGFTRWKDGRKGEPRFLDHYRDFVNHTGLIEIGSRPSVESLRPHLKLDTIGWDMAVPDVVRAAKFMEELRAYEAKDQFPNLIIICLPNDHTSGTSPGTPTPAAQVADNDLAIGQIVEAVSHSKFWKETCIFAIEDDPQAGWDHVSAYRTTAYVASPYTKRKTVVSTPYNQTSLIRTMEQILGLPPMNQMDASADPMFDCFTATPDFTPYLSVTNQVRLDEMNPEKQALRNPAKRRDAIASSKLDFHLPDRCPEDVLNRILWRAQKGETPYPEWAINRFAKDDDGD
jgi:YVTN family beta-propeller protein